MRRFWFRLLLESLCFSSVCKTVALVPALSTTPRRRGLSSLNTPKNGMILSFSSLAARQICTFEADDFGDTWPYDTADMRRIDESDDERFYDEPRLVTHIDDAAIACLTEYYREEFNRILDDKKNDKAVDVLDLCSSWISHLPEDVPLGRVAGVGMNEAELTANSQLTEHYVQNLNLQPTMSQFADNSFDVICNVVSVDYLTKPLEVFREMYRILRPGGVAIMSFSNRMFATKAVNVWLQADDIGRLSIVGSYFYHSASWSSLVALDLKPERQKAPERPSVKVSCIPWVCFSTTLVNDTRRSSLTRLRNLFRKSWPIPMLLLLGPMLPLL